MMRPEFLTQTNALGLNPRQVMDRLHVRSLDGLKLREAFEVIQRQMLSESSSAPDTSATPATSSAPAHGSATPPASTPVRSAAMPPPPATSGGNFFDEEDDVDITFSFAD
jgi:hypothetical protein